MTKKITGTVDEAAEVVLERSTALPAWEALDNVNLMVSMDVLAGLASPMTDPLKLMVDEVSSKPPNTVSLLFSELSSPVLRTANANTEATTTNAMSTMAVSRPVIPHWSRCNPVNPCCKFMLSFLMVGV